MPEAEPKVIQRSLKSLARMAAGVVIALVVCGVALYAYVSLGGVGVSVPVVKALTGKTVPFKSTDAFDLPEGYSYTVFASGLGKVRVIEPLGEDGLMVSIPKQGQVIRLLPDRDGDGASDGMHLVADGLPTVHGIEVIDGYLYAGLTSLVVRLKLDADYRAVGEAELVSAPFAGNGSHWSRTIRLGPDGMLYFQIGSTCNVCEEDRGTLVRVSTDADASEPELFAAGLRNTVGFDWNADGELFGVDNGRDWLGDDYPACELNHIVEDGFYGWPYRNNDYDLDPDFGTAPGARQHKHLAPEHKFGAHTAPLSIHFLRGDWPGHAGRALVALHGSWNRKTKQGYKVMSLEWDAGGVIRERPFMTGFLRSGGNVIGRPVDIKEQDGSIYVSDDYSGSIFRITAQESASGTPPPEDARELGARLVSTYGCISCHGDGDWALAPKFADMQLGVEYDRESLLGALTAPPASMPAWNYLEGEKEAIVDYLLEQY